MMLDIGELIFCVDAATAIELGIRLVESIVLVVFGCVAVVVVLKPVVGVCAVILESMELISRVDAEVVVVLRVVVVVVKTVVDALEVILENTELISRVNAEVVVVLRIVVVVAKPVVAA